MGEAAVARVALAARSRHDGNRTCRSLSTPRLPQTPADMTRSTMTLNCHVGTCDTVISFRFGFRSDYGKNSDKVRNEFGSKILRFSSDIVVIYYL